MGIEWVGLAIDCEWAGPMARFYEGLLGFEVRDLGSGGRWAQLFDPNGGVHINIQGSIPPAIRSACSSRASNTQVCISGPRRAPSTQGGKPEVRAVPDPMPLGLDGQSERDA